MSKLRVSHVKISNILGVEELEFDPGKAVTLISGSNGSGKTSVLEALRAALAGGHDAKLLRNGEKKAEVVLVLSDGVKIEKKISEGRSGVTVTHPKTGAMSAPQTILNELTDHLAANPISFLTASAKDRVKTFLELVDPTPDPEKLSAITDLCSDQFSPANDAFGTLERAAKDLSAQRRNINREVKEKRASVRQIRDSLPEGAPPEDTEKELANIEEEMKEANNRLTRTIESIRAEADKKIEDAKELHQKKIAGLQDRNRELVAFSKAASAAELAESMEASLKALEQDAETFTEALENVQSLSKELCSELPIAGAEILDGELFIDGVAFDTLNESRRVQVAVELSELHAANKSLPLICVDGLERLDSDSMTLFLEAAKKSDCQMIMTRVTDIPGLSVEAE